MRPDIRHLVSFAALGGVGFRNHNAGHRRHLRASEGLPQKPQKAKRARKAAKASKPPPHLRNRPVYAFLGLLVDLLLVPTRAYFHVCLMLHVWQEPEFVAYFERIYSTKTEGVEEFLSATWWCGLGSKTLLARQATIASFQHKTFTLDLEVAPSLYSRAEISTATICRINDHTWEVLVSLTGVVSKPWFISNNILKVTCYSYFTIHPKAVV